MIPEKTEVTLSGSSLSVRGPLGVVSRTFKSDIGIAIADTQIVFTPKNNAKPTRSLWGTYASHVRNMIEGVNKAYQKKLLIEGVGYKADVQGKDVVLAIGFSHPVRLPIPEGIKVTTEKGVITIEGIDKELVGHFSALIRSKKPPEPYKGKGIRYEKEVVRRKQGKRAA